MVQSCIRRSSRERSIGLDVYCIAVWIFYAFFQKYLLPVPIPEKETAVICIFGSYLLSRRPLRLRDRRVWLCGILLVYYGLDAVWKEGPGQGLTGAIAMLSWWICLLVCIVADRNEDEIRLLLNVLKWTCFACAVLIAVQNPPFSGGETLLVGRVDINRNEIVERVLPGLMLQLIQITRPGRAKPSQYLMAALMIYTCLLPNSRGGFVSLAAAVGLILLEYSQRFQKEHGGRFSGRLLLGAAVLLVGLYVLLPEEYIARLWRFDEWDLDDTGRLSLWQDGIATVTDPLLGMGPSYYELHSTSRWRLYGVHNMFIDIYIATGLIGLVLIVLLFWSFARRDFLALAILSMPVARTMVEAGRSYGTWMILAILGILLNYCDQNRITVTEFFDRLYSRADEARAAPARDTCIRAARRGRQRGMERNGRA